MSFGFLIITVWSYYFFPWLFSAGVHGYIPALPSNDTTVNAGGNASHLDMQWYGGGFTENVSYQLVGANSNGVSQVCFYSLRFTMITFYRVHFSRGLWYTSRKIS